MCLKKTNRKGIFVAEWLLDASTGENNVLNKKKALIFQGFCYIISNVLKNAGMMELADVLDSKSSGSDTVRVRPPLPAPIKRKCDRKVVFPLDFLIMGGRTREGRHSIRPKVLH